jgi:hypothetical protein
MATHRLQRECHGKLATSGRSPAPSRSTKLHHEAAVRRTDQVADVGGHQPPTSIAISANGSMRASTSSPLTLAGEPPDPRASEPCGRIPTLSGGAWSDAPTNLVELARSSTWAARRDRHSQRRKIHW